MAAKSSATNTVRRVRFRSTMCWPPREAGVKPRPPKPVSRPECMSTRPTSGGEQNLDDCEESEHALRLAARPAGPRACDLEAPRRSHVLHLERRVVDPELLVEERLELEPDSVTVRPGLDEDVGRESRKAVGNRPDVEVVRLDDPGVRRDRRPTSAGAADSGAPSRKIRPDSRRSDRGGGEHGARRAATKRPGRAGSSP